MLDAISNGRQSSLTNMPDVEMRIIQKVNLKSENYNNVSTRRNLSKISSTFE